jgi:hypothetical protein
MVKDSDILVSLRVGNLQLHAGRDSLEENARGVIVWTSLVASMLPAYLHACSRSRD